ncbi:nicotinamide riboside transporter PnuC [Spiroplasma taiwanense]|uniref:Nicotinamide mononucleotide transporter PnuC n=1 Tax=Spiroplasma taiwanense CT-1 TaxID=1276220 RepID=S5MHK7_9MOLU|nr:nicotinamide riboside transporter PnuC [Spiroplasma taiwanense]AGR41340.1 nicotinamide mononucleotide transporter PnuC [Spiroplasma taiwanense CT-1]
MFVIYFLILILVLGIIAKDIAITIIAGITGTIGVILGAKGKISSFIIASINSILYIIIALEGMLLSSVILHAGFYIPMNIIGFALWFKKRNNQGDVFARFLSIQGIILVCVTLILIWVSYSLIMINFTEAQNVWLDSFVLVESIIAVILMIFRYVDQWFLWLLVNFINLVMWIIILVNIENEAYEQSTAIIFIIMHISYLINSIYGFLNWIKLNKNLQKQKPKQLTYEELKQLSTKKK